MTDKNLKAILERRRKKWASREPGEIDLHRRAISEYLKNFPVQIPRDQFERFIGSLPDAYVRRFSPPEVVKHYIAFRNYQLGQTVTILSPSVDGWNLTILTGDHPYLLAQISGTLTLHDLNILEAEAFTPPERVVLDHFLIQDPGGYLRDESRRRRFQTVLEEDVRAERLPELLRQKIPNLPGLEPSEVVIEVASLPELSETLVSLECPDRLGLLFRVATALSEKGCDISSAYIDTQEGRVHDIFLVTREGQPLSPDRSDELAEYLRKALR